MKRQPPGPRLTTRRQALALFGSAVPASLLVGGTFARAAETPSFDRAHTLWDAVLRRCVDTQGRVDYARVATDRDFSAYLVQLAAVPREELGTWPRAAQVAFWINAYNAFTFQLIVEEQVKTSIRDLVPDPWERARWKVAGEIVSLNFIEHSRLRSVLKEPRVHFALVCAARSCPVLLNRAFVEEGLDATLDRAMRTFLADRGRNRIDVGGARIVLNPILQWFGKDFVGWVGVPEVPELSGRPPAEVAVLRLLYAAANDAERVMISANRFALQWADYDWRLNG